MITGKMFDEFIWYHFRPGGVIVHKFRANSANVEEGQKHKHKQFGGEKCSGTGQGSTKLFLGMMFSFWGQVKHVNTLPSELLMCCFQFVGGPLVSSSLPLEVDTGWRSFPLKIGAEFWEGDATKHFSVRKGFFQ